MELLCFERLEELDFPKLMTIYREGNLQTISYFFPDETDLEAGLRKVEEKFYEYYRDDFLAGAGNRCFILADGEVWASSVRLFPVPGGRNAWHAEALATAPELRRRGYASALFRLLFDRLAQDGDFVITDSVRRTNAASLALHRSVGFEIFQDPAVCLLNGREDPKSYGLRYRGAERIENRGPDPF